MKNKLVFLLSTLLFTVNIGFAQQNGPYSLNLKNDAIVLGLGTGLSIFSYLRESNTIGLSKNEILNLDRNNVNPFDRIAINNSSEPAAILSDIGLLASLAASASLVVPKSARKDFKKIFVMGIEAVTLNYAATYLTKTAFLRNRPYMYRDQTPFDQNDKDGRLSFISGHSSFSAVSMVFVYTSLTPYLKNDLYKNLLLTSTILIPTTVAYLRVKAGKHFPTDVIAGVTTGALIGYLVPNLHKSESNKLSFTPYGSGFSLTYTIH